MLGKIDLVQQGIPEQDSEQAYTFRGSKNETIINVQAVQIIQ